MNTIVKTKRNKNLVNITRRLKEIENLSKKKKTKRNKNLTKNKPPPKIEIQYTLTTINPWRNLNHN